MVYFLLLLVLLAKMEANIGSLSDDVLTYIVGLLPVKDICKLDSALCHVQLRSRYMGALLQTSVAVPVSLNNYAKFDGSPHIKWALSRNVRMQEMALVGGFEVLDPTDCTLLRQVTTLNWYNFCPRYPFQWGDYSMWELSNITSLSFHSNRHLNLHLVIDAVAVRCPNLQVLKVRCEEKEHCCNNFGSLMDLVTSCPYLHSLFLWNIIITGKEDLDLLKQVKFLVLLGEASADALHRPFADDQYDTSLSRAIVQEKLFFARNCSINRNKIQVIWKGLSTHTMGEYINEMVPDMTILGTIDDSDCVFALPILRQCRNIRNVYLNNCVHLTTEMMLLIVTLPSLQRILLQNNTTLERILPDDANIICNANVVDIINFTRLSEISVGHFWSCCPRLERHNLQIS